MLSAPRIYLLEGRATSGHKQEDPDPRGGQKSTESKGSQPRTGQDHDPMFVCTRILSRSFPRISNCKKGTWRTVRTSLQNCLTVRDQANRRSSSEAFRSYTSGLLPYTLESIGYLDEINSADSLKRFVQRLPFHLKTKFVEVADHIQEAGQRTNISHITEFVKIKSKAANNPVFALVAW